MKICYVDGSCSANGSEEAVGGFGVVILDESENLISTHWETAQGTTNNRMELSAILYAFMKYGNQEELVIYSDSAYCVNALNSWMYSWKKNGWLKSDNRPPENLDLFMKFDSLFALGYNMDLRKCKGHTGDKWNELADKLATRRN